MRCRLAKSIWCFDNTWPSPGDGPLVGAGESDGGLEVVVHEQVALDEAREQQVVGVEEDDELPAALAEALDLRAQLADVPWEPDRAEPRVLQLVEDGRHDGRRLVGRAVVDDDALEALMGLRMDRAHGVGDELGVVEAGDDDGDERFGHWQGRVGLHGEWGGGVSSATTLAIRIRRRTSTIGAPPLTCIPVTAGSC